MASIWDEAHQRFEMVCSPTIDPIDPFSYANLAINNLSSNAIAVNTINGGLADFAITFSLSNTNTNASPVVLTDLGATVFYGLYILLIRPTDSANSSYPHGIFLVGKNGSLTCGQVVRILGIKGGTGIATGSNLDMQWLAGSTQPAIFYRPAPTSATTISYTVKVITV
jgi:hypothetical protein